MLALYDVECQFLPHVILICINQTPLGVQSSCAPPKTAHPQADRRK